MRSFKTMAATGLAIATLIASFTVAGAIYVDPIADLFGLGTDDGVATLASPERLEGDRHGELVEIALGAEYDRGRAPAVVTARTDRFVDIDGDMIEFALGAEYDVERAPAAVASRADGFIYVDGDMIEFALGAEYYWETPPRAANPVVTTGANDFDEQLMAFALQNEVGAWTPPTVRTAAVSGVDPYEEHGRLIDYVLQVEMSEYE